MKGLQSNGWFFFFPFKVPVDECLLCISEIIVVECSHPATDGQVTGCECQPSHFILCCGNVSASLLHLAGC